MLFVYQKDLRGHVKVGLKKGNSIVKINQRVDVKGVITKVTPPFCKSARLPLRYCNNARRREQDYPILVHPYQGA